MDTLLTNWGGTLRSDRMNLIRGDENNMRIIIASTKSIRSNLEYCW